MLFCAQYEKVWHSVHISFNFCPFTNGRIQSQSEVKWDQTSCNIRVGHKINLYSFHFIWKKVHRKGGAGSGGGGEGGRGQQYQVVHCLQLCSSILRCSFLHSFQSRQSCACHDNRI